MGNDGWSSSLGRTQNFFDGGSAARLNHLGAMEENKTMDGPPALKTPTQTNPLAANSGMGG